MSQTVSLRLPDTTAEWLRATARRTGHSSMNSAPNS